MVLTFLIFIISIIVKVKLASKWIKVRGNGLFKKCIFNTRVLKFGFKNKKLRTVVKILYNSLLKQNLFDYYIIKHIKLKLMIIFLNND